MEDTNPEVEALQAADNAFREARAAGDIERLRSLLTEDFTMVRDDGHVLDARHYLEVVAKVRLDSKEPSRSLTVRIHGDTGVVIGTHSVSGASSSGSHFVWKASVTRVWVRESGAWKLFSFHYHHL